MASKRAIRRRACDGKRRYASSAEAEAAIKGHGLNQYKCQFCGAWHNGHVPRGKRHRRT